MFKYEPLKLHLQFFGEEIPTGEPTPPTSATAELNFDVVQKFIQENEDAKKWLQSEKDSHFSKSLDTWKQNNLDKIVQEKVKELYPQETEEQRRIRELEQSIENMKRQEQVANIKVSAVQYANEKGLPAQIIDRFIGDDEEATKKNLDELASIFEPYIQQKVDERFKNNGYNPQKGGEPANITFAEKVAREKAQQQQKDQFNPWGTNAQANTTANDTFAKFW